MPDKTAGDKQVKEWASDAGTGTASGGGGGATEDPVSKGERIWGGSFRGRWPFGKGGKGGGGKDGGN